MDEANLRHCIFRRPRASGEDMVRDLRERLAMFGCRTDSQIKRALTFEQVKQYNLVPNPAKTEQTPGQRHTLKSLVMNHGN